MFVLFACLEVNSEQGATSSDETTFFPSSENTLIYRTFFTLHNYLKFIKAFECGELESSCRFKNITAAK